MLVTTWLVAMNKLQIVESFTKNKMEKMGPVGALGADDPVED